MRLPKPHTHLSLRSTPADQISPQNKLPCGYVLTHIRKAHVYYGDFKHLKSDGHDFLTVSLKVDMRLNIQGYVDMV